MMPYSIDHRSQPDLPRWVSMCLIIASERSLPLRNSRHPLELGASPTGQIRVGVAHGLSELVLTSPSVHSDDRFQTFACWLASDWTASLIQQIPAGEIDCGVGLLTQAHALNDNLRRLSLGRERIVVVSSSISSTKPDGSPWPLRNLKEKRGFSTPADAAAATP